MEMNIEKMATKVAEEALDDYLYKGKTLREWIDLMVKFEKEYKTLPMGKYPASISGCDMEGDKPKEVFGYDEYKDIRETLVGLTLKGYTSEMIKTVLEQMQGTVKQKEDKHNCDTCANSKTYKCTICKNNSQFEEVKEDTRFICNTCKHKYRCVYYEYAKEFLEQNLNNDMKCERYIKE